MLILVVWATVCPAKDSESEGTSTNRQPVGATGASSLSGKQLAFFAPIPLRGYGTVSGILSQASSGATVLDITCESEEKAQLLQAKYLSDLQVLQGVSAIEIRSTGVTWQAFTISGQGLVVAFQQDKRVWIVAAQKENDLRAILESRNGVDFRAASTRPAVEVPMYLDRWDQFGFRFYYRPWDLPKGKSAATYKFLDEFQYAQDQGRLGFVLWARPNVHDSGEGLGLDPLWDWAVWAAEEKHLPIGINITGGTGYGVMRQMAQNRYRDQTMMKMPQFSGNYHKVADPTVGAQGAMSWHATTARAMEYGILQDIVRWTSRLPNVVSYLEPSAEIKHGQQEFFLEYGPLADDSYRIFLREKYKNLQILNRHWETDLAAWDRVHVPEMASFLGWSNDSLDLSGKWKIHYEKLNDAKEGSLWDMVTMKPTAISTKKLSDEVFASDYDDSSWPEVQAPGSDISMLLPKRPALYRRTFDVPNSWAKPGSKLWLYIWDLNLAHRDILTVGVNGKLVGQSVLMDSMPRFIHWGAVEVTGALKPGKNQITLRLPKGMMAYRIYLSKVEPKIYPELGRGKNAQWVDFYDWIVWSRRQVITYGMEMIRAIDPNRQIVLMAPDAYADMIKECALAYGGNFHNTGWMGGVWGDMLPALMRGAGLPFTLEPGGPASNRVELQKMIGRYCTEGIQGIDYFDHIGRVMWNAEIKEQFEEDLPNIKLIGKYHAPAAQVAALYSDRVAGLTAYPWGLKNPDVVMGAGYWNWNVRANLQGLYESDAVSELSFASGDVSRYSVIIDTNTSVMDESLLAGIEQYVREGGTFITFAQTGRHSTTEPNVWPISRLTGYRVTHIDSAEGKAGRPLHPAQNQTIIGGSWKEYLANGLSLKKESSDATDLMYWPDGSTAVGFRPLGKGFIVQVGCKFTDTGIPDRIEPSGSASRPFKESNELQNEALTRLVDSLLRWRHVAPVSGKLEPANDQVILRHFVSNNGLYDVWVLWNQGPVKDATGRVVLPSQPEVNSVFDVKLGKLAVVEGNQFMVRLRPLEVRSYLTPRKAIGAASGEWFALQRDWWRGTHPASPAMTLSHPDEKYAVNLGKDWAFKSLAEKEDGASYAGLEVNDQAWEKIQFGIWTLPNHRGVSHGILRKTFTVPAAWSDGEVSLWIMSLSSISFLQEGRIWLDGKLLRDWNAAGLAGDLANGQLRANTTHTLAVEIRGHSDVCGSNGSPWLAWYPKPAWSLDLAGEWTPTQDALQPEAPVQLPGVFKAYTLRRTVDIPAQTKNQTVTIHVDADGPLVGVLVNGHLVRRFHHLIGSRWQITITPWVKPGERNELELFCWGGAAQGRIRSVRLDFFERNRYP